MDAEKWDGIQSPQKYFLSKQNIFGLRFKYIEN